VILFIHGFASCGLGEKSRALGEYFGIKQVLTPNLSHEPETALQQLEQLIEQHPVDLLVGSSLGGYYATWLNRGPRQPIPTVLINPAIAPFQQLEDYIGMHQRWCDGEPFSLNRQHIDTFKSLYREQLRENERYLVLLQSNDEVLDYRLAAAYYARKDVIIEQGGSHRFDHFENQLPRITTWREHNAKESQSPA